MLLSSIEQTSKLLENIWGNWENGMKKVYHSQQEFKKVSIDALQKQQDLFHSMATNIVKLEEETKNSLQQFSKTFKENGNKFHNEETAMLFENWIDKMTDITNRLQHISVTPSKSFLTIVEQSQNRLYDSLKKVAEEQDKLQIETKDMIDSFMTHLKESQQSLAKAIEEQTKETLEEFKANFMFQFGKADNQSQYSQLLNKSKKVMNRPFNDIEVGDTATYTRKVTNQDILDFASLTEDVNPLHIDDEYAAKSIFKERIGHGMLTASFISTLLGTILPGKDIIYLSQNCKFTAPVKIGDTLKVVGEVIDKRSDKKILTLQTNVYNQNDEIVLEGNAVVMKKE